MLRLSDNELELFVKLLGGGEYDRTLHMCHMTRYDAVNLIMRITNELKLRDENRREYEEQQEFIQIEKSKERNTYKANSYKGRKEHARKNNDERLKKL